MSRLCFRLAPLALLLTLAPTASAWADDFRDLFDGKGLDGWVVEGPDRDKAGRPMWSVEDGRIVCLGEGFGFLRYDRREFGDFTLRVEYRFTPRPGVKTQGNSGLGIRTGRFDPGRSRETRPSYAAFEVQLLDDAGSPPSAHGTGSLYRYKGPTTNPARPAPEWNTIEVACAGPRITIRLNGRTILEADQSELADVKSRPAGVPAPKDKPRRGYVALQSHSGRVEFRKVQIREDSTSARGDAPAPRAEGRASRLRSARVTILSTMLADMKGVGEWGFAAIVEADGHRVLFDTGARPETVLANARELGVDLSGVTDVILSHHHTDHTGGLLTLRRALMKDHPQALSRCYVGRGIFLPRPRENGGDSNETLALKAPYEATGGRFVEIGAPMEVFPGAWLTGPVPRKHPERNWSGRGQVRTAEGLAEDTIPEDMSLVLDTDRGLVVVAGCGHAGVINTLEFARGSIREAPVVAVVGGLHLFNADGATLDWTADKLRGMGLGHLLGAHCTGIEAVHILRGRLGLDRRTCAVGAVGAGFVLGEGIRPGMIAH